MRCMCTEISDTIAVKSAAAAMAASVITCLVLARVHRVSEDHFAKKLALQVCLLSLVSLVVALHRATAYDFWLSWFLTVNRSRSKYRDTDRFQLLSKK